MTLYVDRREDQKAHHAPALSPYLRRYITPASLVEQTELYSADVCHFAHLPGGRIGNIGYEIKHVSDALQCMEDGRLGGVDGQLERMGKEYAIRWVVIEDDLRPDTSTGVLMKWVKREKEKRVRVTQSSKSSKSSLSSSSLAGRWVPAHFAGSRTILYSTLIKWLTIVCFDHGAMLWRTSSREETAQFLAAQYHLWTAKEYEMHKSLRTFNISQQMSRPAYVSDDVRLKAKIVNAFDGFGFEKALAVAREFARESPREMLTVMTPERLQKVEGVGKVLALKLAERVNRRGRK